MLLLEVLLHQLVVEVGLPLDVLESDEVLVVGQFRHSFSLHHGSLAICQNMREGRACGFKGTHKLGDGRGLYIGTLVH